MPRDSLLNQRLGEYQVEALLGKGGMARVYRGVDVNLDRTVAVKVIDTPYRADSEYHQRFEREAQAIAQLQHSSIVQLYRFGEQDGMLYMAIQFVEGEDLEATLFRYRQQGKYLEPEKIFQITQDICTALDYAHQRRVIHRDLKPPNILINKQGRAILSDFGLVLMIEIGTRGEVLGSPDYISPEQAISSAKVVPQSDLYSFGVILYEMFTGQVPFFAETPLDLALKHITDVPPMPRSIRSEINPAVEAVLLKAMAKKIEDRYTTGKELALALDAALKSSLRPKPELASLHQPILGNEPSFSAPAQIATTPAQKISSHRGKSESWRKRPNDDIDDISWINCFFIALIVVFFLVLCGILSFLLPILVANIWQ